MLRAELAVTSGKPVLARRRHDGKPAPDAFLSFLQAVVRDVDKPVRASLCADFRYDTSERRPVFELPIELVDKKSDKPISRARIEGLQVGFGPADSPAGHMEISVVGSRLFIRLSTAQSLAIGDTAGRMAYERAAKLADAFTEEVKPT